MYCLRLLHDNHRPYMYMHTHTPCGYDARVLIYSYSRRNCNPGLCAGVVLNNSTIKIGAHHWVLSTRTVPQP